ncbi:MAG: DUF120 domain-containing protein [Halopseudomonas aestusnigri]
MKNKLPNSTDVTITGILVSGRGYGADMVMVNQRIIEDKLDATPYPGTLNIVLDVPLLLKRADQLDEKGKLFGVRGIINDIPCLLYRFNYTPLHVLEVIAPVHLRKTFGLKDGQEIEILVSEENITSPTSWRCRVWELFYKGRLEVYYDDRMIKLFLSRGIKFFHKKACQSKNEFM